MTFHKIDMTDDPRRAHFAYFRSLPNPHVGVTADVDVTEMVEHCRREGWSFYLAFLRAAALAANRVPELRRRIRRDCVVEYDSCGTSHIELLEDGTYCYCTLYHATEKTLREYMTYAETERALCRAKASIEEDEDVEGLFFVTSLPWLHYSGLVQPTAGPEDSNPRITWGRYAPDHRGRLMLPLTLLCHHALVDGLQIAAFFREVEKCMAQLCASARA